MVEGVDKKLVDYIENHIFPLYEKNESGHGIRHINYVIRRSMEFSKQFSDIDLDMVYIIAAFHDLAHHIDKDRHEELSSQMFCEDRFLKNYFHDDKRKVIKEAIEDHRASLDGEPRSVYGKIISSADRNTSVSSTLQRVHSYSLKYHLDFDLGQMIEHAYQFVNKKFGENGYAKVYCKDLEYDKFKKEICELLKDKYLFSCEYLKVNGINDVEKIS